MSSSETALGGPEAGGLGLADAILAEAARAEARAAASTLAVDSPRGETPAGEVVYGLLTLAGVEVALPLSALREVVPCPDEFSELPASVEGLLGAISVRELVVPVLDLRPRLGAPAERAHDQVVVIIAQDDQILGLLADGAQGITEVPRADLRAVQASDGPLLFSHTFRHPTLGTVISVLHVAAILRLPGVPTVHDPAAVSEGPRQLAHGQAGPRRTLTLLRCGQHVLGIEVGHVHTTLAGTVPEPSVLGSPVCPGVIEYTDLHVPVVDPLVLLGLGGLGAEGTGAGLVLDLGDGFVVLALSALVDITELAGEEILPLPPFSVRRPELLAGITDVEGVGQCLILDGDALLADPDLRGLASMNTPAGADGEADEADASSVASGREAVASAREAVASARESAAQDERVYLTYSVGRDVATPLEQIAEIIALPPTRTPTDVDDTVLGVAVHRRAAVPILCLPTLLNLPRPPITSATCLLLVPVDGETVGFAVEALRAIDTLAWEDRKAQEASSLDHAANAVPDLSRSIRTAPLISVGENPRLLPDLDLHAIARAARAQMSGGPGTSAVPMGPGGSEAPRAMAARG